MSALDDLIEALRNARSSVFRLEGHQDYPDDELWQAQQRGEQWEQSEDLASWCALVSGNRARGVAWTRVRIVVEPWTPYTRWEVEDHYPHNARAGEDVRLARAAEPLAFPDFWLVDDERAWFLTYDESGRMTVAAATGPDLPMLRVRRDDALSRSERPSPAAT